MACCGCSNKEKEKEPVSEETISSKIEEIASRNTAVGLSVVAVKDGKIIYHQNTGYKDLEKKMPIGDDDILRIASISKSFTALGILQLVEQGKLNLDADISELVGFRVRNPKFPEVPITIRMLLSHSSSMSDANGYYSINKINPDSSATWKNAWNSYEPGTRYQYCNMGYNTLGTILESVSGERFDKYIVNHILNPLGIYGGYDVSSLDSTKFIKIYRYNKANNSFTQSEDAYDPRKDEIENYKMGHSAPIFSPTGGLKISALGLAKVMMMHMNYGSLDGVKIIDSTTAAIMQSSIIPTDHAGEYYGMATITSDFLLKGHQMIGHDGVALGAYTAMYWDKERNFGFVIMTNGCNPKQDGVLLNILCEAASCMYDNLISSKTQN